MSSLLLHSSTKLQLAALGRSLPHATLLEGPKGVGLLRVARELAHPHSRAPLVLQPLKDQQFNRDTGSIGVDAVRQLYQQLAGKSATARVVIIQDADSMTTQAQNAFLKLLEEPGQSVSFILLAHAGRKLLPTVRSRVQTVHVQPVSKEQSVDFLRQIGVTDQTKVQQLLFMAQGLPALLEQLSSDEERFTRYAAAMRNARTMLQSEAYDRLLVVHGYKDDRPAAQLLLESMLRILRYTVLAQPSQEAIEQMDAILIAQDRLRGNGSVRLVLAALVL